MSIPVTVEELEGYPGEDFQQIRLSACTSCDSEDTRYNVRTDEYSCRKCGLIGTVNEFVTHYRELHPERKAVRPSLEETVAASQHPIETVLAGIDER